MEVVTRDIVFPKDADRLKITCMGDLHLGAEDCHTKLLNEAVAKLAAEPSHYWLGMGDYHEWLTPGDKRFEFRNLPKQEQGRAMYDFLRRESRSVVDYLRPIAGQCLGLVRGNHEDTISSRLLFPVHEEICERLTPDPNLNLNLMYSGVIRLRVRDSDTSRKPVEKRLYYHHGYGGGRLVGAKVNNLKRLASAFPGNDFYVMGHVHERACSFDATIDISKTKDELKEKVCVVGMSGTFKRTYTQGETGYGEKFAYPPTALGVITFYLYRNGAGYDTGFDCRQNGLPA